MLLGIVAFYHTLLCARLAICVGGGNKKVVLDHAMKAYRGNRCISPPIFNLGIKLRRLTEFLLTATLLPGYNPGTD